MSANNTLEVIRNQAAILNARIEELTYTKRNLESELRRITERIDFYRRDLNSLRLDAKIISDEAEEA